MAKRFLIALLILFLTFILNAFLFPFPDSQNSNFKDLKIGTSFSFERAGWFGLDTRTSFEKLVSSRKFAWIRVSFFWDSMTDDLGNLKIDDLVFAAKEAEKYNVKLVVAIGAKTPYYPEYHIPKKYADSLKNGQEIGLDSPVAPALLKTDVKLVKALSKYKSIGWWQVENEPFLANVNNWKISKNLLAWEVVAVRKSDPFYRPIILNQSVGSLFDRNVASVLSLLRPGDVLGASAYFVTRGERLMEFTAFGKNVVIPWPNFLNWPVQSWLLFSPNYVSMKNEALSKGVDFWILEAQAEPYVYDLKGAQGNNFEFTAADIKKVASFFYSKKIKTIGLWEAPFWLYREKIGDKSWLDSVGVLK